MTELSTTEAKQVEQAAKELLPKGRVYAFNIGWQGGFDDGIDFALSHILPSRLQQATTSPDILREILKPFAEWIRSREGEQKMSLNDHDWYWDSDLDGAAPLSDEELAEQYIQFITDKSKEDARIN